MCDWIMRIQYFNYDEDTYMTVMLRLMNEDMPVDACVVLICIMQWSDLWKKYFWKAILSLTIGTSNPLWLVYSNFHKYIVTSLVNHKRQESKVEAYQLFSNKHICYKITLIIRSFLSIFQKCNQFSCDVKIVSVIGIFIP